MTKRFGWLAVLIAVTQLSLASIGWSQVSQTILTDADSTVRGVCRWDAPQDVCYEPRGTADNITEDWDDHPRYLRVHDQNALDVAYLHFDLSGIAPNSQVNSARFQLDAQSNSWGDTSVMVVAIVDEATDWDLDAVPESEIYGANAPHLDWSDWEDELDIPDSHRFNLPTPFLDEGDTKSDKVRQLVDTFEPIFIASTDGDTSGTVDDPGNSYGGYACCDVGDGGGGSSDGGDNPWPVKNAIDIDVTSLVQWKLGQNADYSDFAATDRNLTLMVRTELGTGGGFLRFVARESEFLGGDEDLQPGRLVLDTTGGGIVGDFNNDGLLNIDDVNALTREIHAQTNGALYDLNNDSKVDDLDLARWVRDEKKTWFGDANLDGSFGSSDLVQIFTAGKYEQDADAGWDEGDWTGDLRFNSSDLVAAFSDGGYEAGPRAAVSAVPEPSTLMLSLLGLLGLAGRRRVR